MLTALGASTAVRKHTTHCCAIWMRINIRLGNRSMTISHPAIQQEQVLLPGLLHHHQVIFPHVLREHERAKLMLNLNSCVTGGVHLAITSVISRRHLNNEIRPLSVQWRHLMVCAQQPSFKSGIYQESISEQECFSTQVRVSQLLNHH